MTTYIAAGLAAAVLILLSAFRVQAAEDDSPTVSVSSTGAGMIKVSWTEVPGAASYNIYRCSKASPYQKIASTAETFYVDETVEDDTPYEYSVTAVINGRETTFRNKGALGYTAYKEAHVYNWQVTDLTPEGFTVSGKISYSGTAKVLYLPVWTEKKGQDDLKWYTLSITDKSFSCRIRASDHNGETGVYVLDPYLNDTFMYCQGPLWVEVPGRDTRITSPAIADLSEEGFTATAAAEAFGSPVKSVKAEIWTAFRGEDDLETVKASYDSATGMISCPVSIRNHNDEAKLYYVRFTVTDKAGGTASLLLHTYVPTTQKCMTFTVIDLGEGSIGGSALLLTSRGKGLLIDTGRSDSAAKVVNALRQHGLNTVDIIITHGDGDHIGTAQAILDAGISIGTVYTDQYPSDVMWDELDRRTSMSVFRKNAKIRGIPSSLTIGDATVTIIGPAKHYSLYDAATGGASQANLNSYWFMITNGSRKILVNGDSELLSSKDMLKSGTDISADIYVLGHHGTQNSLNAAILSAISPEKAVASGRITSDITADTIQKLKDAGIPYYFTSRYGSIDISFRGTLISLNTERNADSPSVYYQVEWKNANGKTLEKDGYVRQGSAPSYDHAAPVLKATAKYTYTFSGWSTDGSTVLKKLPKVTEDLTFIAVYHKTVNQYTITWKNADGSILKTAEVRYGSLPDYDGIPEYPVNDGVAYTFDCWVPAVQKVTGPVVYTAAFTASSPKIRRFSGNDSFETAGQILQEAFENGSQNQIILTSGTSYPYSLMGTALAGALGCPLLVTDPDKLSAAVRQEIDRLRAEDCEILILGGTDVISEGIEEELLKMDALSGVTRLMETAGTPWEAALQLYKLAASEKRWTESGTVIITGRENSADSISIAPYAYASGTPVLFTMKTGNLSAKVMYALQKYKAKRAILIGGTGAVSQAAEDQLTEAGITCLRLGGEDCYQTSRLVFKWVTGKNKKAAFGPETVFSVTAPGFAAEQNSLEAIAGAALLGVKRNPVLLVSEETAAIQILYKTLKGHEEQIGTAYIFGGTGAVSEQLTCRIADAVSKDR